MVPFQFSSGPFTDPFLSGVIGVLYCLQDVFQIKMRNDCSEQDVFQIKMRNDCSEQVCDSCWIRPGGMNPSGNAFLSRMWITTRCLNLQFSTY